MARQTRAHGSQGEGSGSRTVLSKLLWFVGLWAAGVLAVTVLGQLIRWAIMP